MENKFLEQKIQERNEIEAKAREVSINKRPGTLSARKRLEFLFDPGTFTEIDLYIKHNARGFGMEDKRNFGDGVITGFGEIKGRLAYAFSQDYSFLGGSLGKAQADKICKIMDLAVKAGAPVIGINDSGGARIQEGVMSLAGYGEIFFRNVRNSGVIPQISLIMGPCAGGAVYSPAVTDFILMTKATSYMFVTGPKVVKQATFEDIDFENLGGGMVHTSKSGVAHILAENDLDCILKARRLLSYLPQNNFEEPPEVETQDDPDRKNTNILPIIPDSSSKPYDVKKIIEDVVDLNTFFEIQTNFAKNIVTGFARLDGKVVGIIANQPLVLAGCLDIDASRKASRFIRTCNGFHIPIISLIDVPGFLPGSDQEHNGIITHGAKLLFAYAEATVPKISCILRKAYGGAYIVMSSKHIGGDFNLAWPIAEIAVMGAKGAVEILYKKELANHENQNQEYDKFVNLYNEKFSNPYMAAEYGYIDSVIDPADTRREIIKCLKAIKTKRETNKIKKSGNIPL
jgi:propionyl-CoA carboxylase beta chain